MNGGTTVDAVSNVPKRSPGAGATPSASPLRDSLPPGIGEQAIRDGVLHAFGSPLRRRQRAADGMLNHVYYVWTESGAAGVVRMQVRGERHFESECWAIRRCLSLDLPVPEVLGLEHHILDTGDILSVIVQKRLPGRPLSQQIANGQFAEDDIRHLANQAGGMLARINSVDVAGAGLLSGDGRGTQATLEESLRWVEHSSTLLAAASQLSVAAEIDSAVGRLADQPLRYGNRTRLLHGDYATKHLLVKRGNVTGIVDFELCQGGDPAQDISYWALVEDDHAPVEWLREGYQQAADLGPDFKQRLQLAMLRGCLSWLSMPTITRPDQQSFATWVIDKLRAILTDMGGGIGRVTTEPIGTLL